MKTERRRLTITAIAIAASLFCTTSGDAKKPDKPGGGGGGSDSAGYTLVPLPDEDGNTNFDGYASGLNEVWIEGEFAGVEVVGNAVGSSAYCWALNAEGTLVETTALPMPANSEAGDVASAHDINDQGMIVGAGGAFSPLILRPLFWLDKSSAPIDLPIPDGLTGVAVDINNHGMIVGQLKDRIAETQLAVVWQVTVDESGPTVVGPVILAEATSVWSPHLNDAGDVVATVSYRGKLWNVDRDGEDLTASAPQDLTGTFLDESGQPRDVILKATAINELGDICGDYYAEAGDPLFGAFLLLDNGTLIDLPPLGSKRYRTQSNNAYDLNDAIDTDSIQVVGDVSFFSKRSGILHSILGVVWQDANATDLERETAQPVSDLQLVGINRISNQGWLSGFGWQADNDPRAVVLVPK